MNRAIVCTGEYAKTPYYFDKVFVNIYSIEELCYVMAENAFLLDKDILDRKLVEWLDKQCGLSDLARELYPMVNRGVEAATFVGTILNYAGYYDEEEVDKIESIFRMNVSLNAFEKMKAKADYLCENRHYHMAIAEYEAMLSQLQENEQELKSYVYNNIGVAYMSLYMYDSAKESFRKAFECFENEAAYKHYLTLLRLSLNDTDYIREVTSDDRLYKYSENIETEINEARREYDDGDMHQQLMEMFALKNERKSSLYYDEIAKIAEHLKDDYRDIILEGNHTDNY